MLVFSKGSIFSSAPVLYWKDDNIFIAIAIGLPDPRKKNIQKWFATFHMFPLRIGSFKTYTIKGRSVGPGPPIFWDGLVFQVLSWNNGLETQRIMYSSLFITVGVLQCKTTTCPPWN